MTPASNSGNDQVRLGDIMLGVVKSLPDTLTVNRGLWHLATARPGKQQSTGAILERNARRYANNTALRYSDWSWTYAEFNAWVNRYAASFREAGIRKGDCVGILLENRPEALVAAAAANKLGAVAGMLNHNQKGDVLKHSVSLVSPKLMVVGAECVETWQSAGITEDDPQAPRQIDWVAEDAHDRCPKGYVDLEVTSGRMSGENPTETQAVTHADACFYIFTSGTTGMPKASVMSHGRWIKAMGGMGLASLRLSKDDVFYCALPLYHNNALTVSWGAAMGAGAALALSRKFSATNFWDEIRHHKATSFCYIGELCRYLLNQPASDKDRSHAVRVIVGNGLRPEIWDEFKNRFGIDRINEFYGASEGNAAFTNSFGIDKTAGYCPLPFAIVEFDAEAEEPAKDEHGRLIKVDKGGVGLLITKVTKSASFDGYTDEKESNKKLLNDVFRKGDEWFNTGDLVKDQGWRHIQFVDRVGDTFRWKGENVATTEVERAITAHPHVQQAVVYGVEVPNMGGRAGMAAITLDVPEDKFNPQNLAEHLCSVLPGYAVPLFLRLRKAHETTGTFKHRKVELKDEGFDPDRVDEPLYALVYRDKGYSRIDTALFQQIVNGDLRL